MNTQVTLGYMGMVPCHCQIPVWSKSTRLEMTLTKSRDPVVREVAPTPDYREKTDPSHCSAQCKICPPALIHTGPCPARQRGIWPWRNENYLKKSRKQNDDCGWERRCAGNEKLIDVPEPFPRASKAVG